MALINKQMFSSWIISLVFNRTTGHFDPHHNRRVKMHTSRFAVILQTLLKGWEDCGKRKTKTVDKARTGLSFCQGGHKPQLFALTSFLGRKRHKNSRTSCRTVLFSSFFFLRSYFWWDRSPTSSRCCSWPWLRTTAARRPGPPWCTPSTTAHRIWTGTGTGRRRSCRRWWKSLLGQRIEQCLILNCNTAMIFDILFRG